MKKLEKDFIVDFKFSAKFMGSGDLEVLATPAIIAFAENTCAAIASDFLAIGETSVGTEIAMDHLAASLIDSVVRVKATLIAQEGKRLSFEFMVYEKERLLASGTHQRAIVSSEKFMNRLIESE